MEYPEQHTRLAPGDKLILYSDGVSEAENMEDDQFGEERLEKVVARHAKSSPKEILDAVRAEVTSFTAGAPQKDDLTLLVLAYQG
jgi:sigma-B regulation protein RsbU (phosphoserine phosphatase)